MRNKLMGTTAAALLAMAAAVSASAQTPTAGATSTCAPAAPAQRIEVKSGTEKNVRFTPWYVATRSMALNLDQEKPKHVDDALEDAAKLRARNVQLASAPATAPLLMGDMLFIGEIEGTPIYARQTEIGDLLPDLAAHLSVSRNLDKVLDDKPFASRFAKQIHTVYTVVESGGAKCR
jgi:hypothetical protein